MKVKFKKLDVNAKIPFQGTSGSAGYDLTALYKKPLGGSLVEYGSGIAVEIPQGYVGLVFPRSSVWKMGCTLTNCVGVIDSDYRGEIKAVFDSYGTGYKQGERFAQLVIVPVPEIEYTEVDELSETQRGTGGYGSTGN